MSWRPILFGAAIACLMATASAQNASTVPTGPMNVQSVPGQSSGLAPFIRMGSPNLLPATAAPQQYTIPQPVGSTSYRFVNPCSVDIRIVSVSGLSSTVTATTGTRFLARTVETLASSANPLGTGAGTRDVSIMTISPVTGQPANDPGGNCVAELTYGNGG